MFSLPQITARPKDHVGFGIYGSADLAAGGFPLLRSVCGLAFWRARTVDRRDPERVIRPAYWSGSIISFGPIAARCSPNRPSNEQAGTAILVGAARKVRDS